MISNNIYMKGFIDGCFDGLHYGHINSLFQSKKMSLTLCVATHLDEEIKNSKNRETIFTYNERFTLLQNCKFVDILYDSVPYNTSIDTITKFGCDIFFHGEDNTDKYPISELKNLKKLEIFKRTNGISITNLLQRLVTYKLNKLVKTNNDKIYLKYLFDNIKNYLSFDIREYKLLIVLNFNWDFFNINHINIINDIKTKYPLYSICIDLIRDSSKYELYNKNEIAITLLGIKNIDHVLLYDDLDYSKYNDVIFMNTENSILNNYVDKLKIYKDMLLSKINIMSYTDNSGPNISLDMYNNILESQFDNILKYLQSLKAINNKDIIVFDIDEVCLCNLPYHDIKIDNFDNEQFNFENGLLPLIPACKQLFDYIHYHNINYAFITGRRNYIRNITIDNLNLFSLNKYVKLYTCDNNYIGNISIYKEECRKDLNTDFNIIMCIGDQRSDISGENIGMPFLLFNPFYTTN